MTDKCKKCGELVQSDDKFCGACGTAISDDENMNKTSIYNRKGVIEMSFIKANEVSKEKLIEILTNAALEVDDQDEPNEVYVRGVDFPLWVSIDDGGKFIKLRTYLKCVDGAPIEELPAFSNSCNSEYILVQFTNTIYEDGTGFINGAHFIYFNFGLIPSQLVYTIKKFSSIFVAAIREFDPDDKFFS